MPSAEQLAAHAGTSHQLLRTTLFISSNPISPFRTIRCSPRQWDQGYPLGEGARALPPHYSFCNENEAIVTCLFTMTYACRRPFFLNLFSRFFLYSSDSGSFVSKIARKLALCHSPQEPASAEKRTSPCQHPFTSLLKYLVSYTYKNARESSPDKLLGGKIAINLSRL